LMVVFWIGAGFYGLAQQPLIDSLSQVLAGYKDQDTTRVKILLDLSRKEDRFLPEQCKAHADEALKLALDLGYKRGVGYAYDALSRHAYTAGEYQVAVDYGLKMLSVFEQLNYRRGVGSAYFNIGGAYISLRDHTQAGVYLRRAMAVEEETGNQAELLSAYNRYGLLMYFMHKYDSALIIHHRLLAKREELHDEGGIAQACNNIGIVWVDKEEPAKAIPYFSRALEVFERIHDKLRIGGACQNLGNAYLSLGDYAKAEQYLMRALGLARDMGTLFELQNVYGYLVDLEELRGNFKKALDYQRLYQGVLDSLYSNEKSELLAAAEVRYETEKKEQTIKLLEKEKQLQAVGQWILVGGVLIIGVIYMLQRSRSKKVRELLSVQQLLNTKLKETDLLKSRFFANISHEFRTPLSLIIAPLEEKLKSRMITDHDKSDLQLAIRNANRLLSLVNQLLDLSRLDAGKMELHLADGNLRNFLQVIAASFESLAESKGIHFIQNHVLPDAKVGYDADKVEKIVGNVLFNAFKFTPTGGTVVLDISAPDAGSMVIRVNDTGKGIPEEDRPYIFSPFYQSRHTLDDGQPGTGLGLALVSELTKLYQGNITLTSIVNSGTSITITLPVAWPELSVVAPVVLEHASGPGRDDLAELVPRVPVFSADDGRDVLLVVEDNRELSNFMVSVFSGEFTVITAADGVRGLALAFEHLPDVIISDVMMPAMDGIELVNRIKADERTSHIPIILLTAKADALSRLEGLRHGADDYLSKPFSVEELRARVNNLIVLRKSLLAHFKKQMEVTPAVDVPDGELTLDDKFIHKVRDLIEANLGDSQFGVEQLAEQMFLSRSQLFRKLKALTGVSPSEVISDFRLEKAARLITMRAETVSQISYAVGFNDQSYFAKRFRKKFGMSPSQYAESV
jgi:signal transduction histidine kinase/DNA-binding response OmpR family regulator